MEHIKNALYLASVAAGAFAMIAVSWALVGVALGVAVRAFRFVAG